MDAFVDVRAVRMLLWLYSAEVAVALILVGVYKAPIYDASVLPTKAGVALIAGGIGLIASGGCLIRQIRASGTLRGRALAIALMTNLVSGLLAFLLLETTLRIAARETQGGLVVGSHALRATWPELTARSREVIAGVAPWGSWDRSYFIYDPELGWTVGPNRRSPDGLYFSSVEGVRTPGPGIRLADHRPRFRVALIGDSNAFSFEVPYEDSWGHHLQQFLGDDVQVLNFGVDGYGIDQMYLRYLRDVRPWKPQLVVLGFVGQDFMRTMAVYPFVSFGWPGYLAKPRFAIENGELELLNVPLPSPEEILETRRIDQLPFVEYDLGYGSQDWRWRFDHGPLLLRFLTSVSSRWPIQDPRVSEGATLALNTRLLTRIAESAAQAGSVVLAVDMDGSVSGYEALVRDAFARAQLSVFDVTSCLSEVPADRRKVASEHHFTGPANRAIARCTAPAIELALRSFEDPAQLR